MAFRKQTTALGCKRLLFLVLALSLLFASSSADMNLIKKTCRESQTQGLCTSMLLRVKRSVSCSDLRCLTRVAVRVALQEAINGTCYIGKILDEPRRPDIDYRALAICLWNYNKAQDDLRTIAGHVATGDYWAAYELIGRTSDYPDNCKTAFASSPNQMTDFNAVLDSMLSVCWEFLDQLIS